MGMLSEADERLISGIRATADALPQEAGEIASMLHKHASEIEGPSSREAAIGKFDEFAVHYKGLRDIMVPGVPREQWDREVKFLRELSRSAMRPRRGSWWRRLVG